MAGKNRKHRHYHKFQADLSYIQTEKSWTVRPVVKLKGTHLAGKEPAQRATKHVSNGDRAIYRALFADGAMNDSDD